MLPWRYTEPKQKGDFPPILNANGEFMGASFDVAGAEHIVKCVNSHGDLVDALRTISYRACEIHTCDGVAKIAEEALKKAGAL